MKQESMNIRRVIRASRLLAEQGHANDTLAALDELAALRKDAERYRWLKCNPTWLGWEHDFRADEVEREIDAAMAAAPAVGAA